MKVHYLLLTALAVTTAACGGRQDLGSDDDAGPDASGGCCADAAISAPAYALSNRRGTVVIDRFGDAACGILKDGTISCWGTVTAATTLAGAFTSLFLADVLCGVLTSGEIACAGITAPAGSDYVRVVTDEAGARVCGLTSAGAVSCTAGNGIAAISLPGPFLDVSLDNDATCTLATDGTPSCTGANGETVLTPAGTLQTFQLVESTADGKTDEVINSCGLLANGMPTCTGSSLTALDAYSEIDFAAADDASGASTGPVFCGISSGTLVCSQLAGKVVLQATDYEHVAVSEALAAASPFACATNTSGKVSCFAADNAGTTPTIGSPSSSLTFQF